MTEQENIKQQPEISFEELQAKDKADFLAAAAEIKKLEDKEEMRTAVQNLIASALEFFGKHRNEKQSFHWLMRKLNFLEMFSNQNVFDRSFSQEQVAEIVNLICEDKEAGSAKETRDIDCRFFSTSYKSDDRETGTVSDQTAIALTKKLQNGETIQEEVTTKLNAWLQNSQMIEDSLRLELLCAILNNPGHIDVGVADAFVREQSNFGGVMLKRLVDQAEGKDLNVTMRVLDVLEAVARFGKWEDWMEAGGQMALEKLEEIADSDKNYFIQKRLEIITQKPNGVRRKIDVQDYDDLKDYRPGIMPLGAQFYENPQGFVEGCAYSKVSSEYGVIYDGKGQADSFFRLDAENKSNLELKDILAGRHTQWESLTEKEKQNLVDNYRVLIGPDFRFEIEQKFKIKLEDFELRTQVQFLNFISDHDVDEMERVTEFIGTKTDQAMINAKLKAFLALELDATAGEKILKLGDDFKNAEAEIFFQKIGELADLASRESGQLQKILLKRETDLKIKDVQAELLKRAAQLIEKFSQEFSGEQTDEQRVRFFLADLEKSKTEIVLLAAALKNGATLEQLKDWDVSIREIPDEGERAEMLEIAERNWNQDPDVKDKVLEGLQKSLQDGVKRKWYLAKFQGKNASFIAFKQIFPGRFYVGSFNVDPDARGLGIGNEIMELALMEEAKENILEATVSPRIPAGTAYVERVGFVINGLISNYQKTGKPFFSIELDKGKNLTYQYRNEGKESEIDEEMIKKRFSEQVDVDQLIGTDTFVLKFDMKNDFERMSATVEKLLLAKNDNGKDISEELPENKYIITRYFRDKEEKEKDVRYFVFEKIKD